MSVAEAVVRVTGRKPLGGNAVRRIVWAASVIVAVIVLSLAVRGLIPMINRPVTQIQIVGRLTHISPSEVAAVADIAPGTRLFDVQMENLESRVAALPWVAKAAITREWPNRIRIRISERRPFARWGDHALIDTSGQVFEPKKDAPNAPQWKTLPELSGPAGQEKNVMDLWRKMSAALAAGPFALAELREDGRGDWTARCRSGVVLRFGGANPVAKLQLLRYTVAPALSQKLNQIAAIDLRYTNGFAVRWRVPAPGQPSTASPLAAGERPSR